MKNIVYLIVVVVVLAIGTALFMMVNNNDKDLMSSMTDIFEDPKSLVPEIQPLNIVTDTLGSVSESVSKSVSSISDSVQESVASVSNSVQESVASATISSAPSILQDSTSAIYKNGHFVAGYNDGALEIINSHGDKKRLKFHTQKINNLYIVNDRLIASSDDGSLSVIDLDTITLRKQMKGHGKGVEGIVAFGNLVFSVSRDRTIKIWEIYSTGLARIIRF